jgi:hypothetical protein
MKKLLFLSLFTFLGFFFHLNAQTAVYFCSETGYYGYCCGTANVGDCAYNKCLSYGGKSPRLIGSIVNQKGYGAIAIGKTTNGSNAIGAAAGMSSQEAADRKAKEYCTQYGGQNPYIDARFYDGN